MAEDNTNERKLVTVFLRNALGGVVPGEKRGLSFSFIQIYSCFWPMVTFIFQPVLSSFHGEFLQKRATCVHRTRNPTNKPVQCRAASQVLRCSKSAGVSLYGSSATGKWINGRKIKTISGSSFFTDSKSKGAGSSLGRVILCRWRVRHDTPTPPLSTMSKNCYRKTVGEICQGLTCFVLESRSGRVAILLSRLMLWEYDKLR